MKLKLILILVMFLLIIYSADARTNLELADNASIILTFEVDLNLSSDRIARIGDMNGTVNTDADAFVGSSAAAFTATSGALSFRNTVFQNFYTFCAWIKHTDPSGSR